MSRLSIDVTDQQHQRLKALAALRGQSIKEFVLGRTLEAAMSEPEQKAMVELESLLDDRIRSAKADKLSKRTVGEIFSEAYRKAGH